MKKREATKQSGVARFDLKNTDSFTPEGAVAWLRLASEQLKGFQLWHPQLHVAHEIFFLKGESYPIPEGTIPKGVLISEFEWVANFSTPPPSPNRFVQPFRDATTLSCIAEMSLSVVFHDRERKGCPEGICALTLMSTPEEGLRLQAHYLHDLTAGGNPPEVMIEHITTELGPVGRDRWILGLMDYVVLPRNIRRYQSAVEIRFAQGEFDGLEQIVEETFRIQGNPKTAHWRVDFGKNFYSRIYDNAGGWYYIPKPELLKANGLTGNAGQLLQLVNKAGFPGKTADLRFLATFDQFQDARGFFELAVRSEKAGEGIDRSALAMFQTDKGVLAQFCFGTKGNDKIVFKVLYPGPGGFGWEDAYQKLVRGERLILADELPPSAP